MKFYLGTHMTEWLSRTEKSLFVSAIQLRRRPFKKVALCSWALDSGGFTELSNHGRWTVTPMAYAEEVRRWRDDFGSLEWAAIQDWMCEPFIIEKTGRSVHAHQMATIESWNDLNRLAPEIPWVPVLQGWEYDDYLSHVDLYKRLGGLDVRQLPLVGLGSVCRRQGTRMVEELTRELSAGGIRIHGFGFKIDGLKRCSSFLASADSLAWSFAARKHNGPMLATCEHRKCANCLPWALKWRKKVLTAIQQGDSYKPPLNLFA